MNFAEVIEQVVTEALAMEGKSRRIHGGPLMEDVEVILEMTPRARGGWMMTDDSGPLLRWFSYRFWSALVDILWYRALGKIVHNSCKFTEKGYIHILVQDVSQDVVLPAGYDNSITISTVTIDIKDSGRGSEIPFFTLV